VSSLDLLKERKKSEGLAIVTTPICSWEEHVVLWEGLEIIIIYRIRQTNKRKKKKEKK
jgi:hypothetical protein